MGNLNEIAKRMAENASVEPVTDEAVQVDEQAPIIDEQPPVEAVDTVEITDEGEQIEQETTEEPEPTYTVKVNGEEREVSLDELRNGYMMQSDYSKKTAEIAERRKRLETQEETIRTKLNDAEALIRFEFADLQSEEMLELKEYDPSSYWEKVEKVNQKAQKFQQQRALEEQKMLEKKQKLFAEEQQKLLEKVPEWMDADKREAEAKELYSHLANLGFTSEEIASNTDHRLFLLARDALKLKKLNEQKPETKLDKTPPKSAKPAAKATKEVIASQQYKKLKDKRKKTGKLSDVYNSLTVR